MVFNPNVIIFLLAFIVVWITILTFFLWQSVGHYNKLTRGMSSKTLKEILESILEHAGISQQRIDELATRCQKIEEDGLLHAQKIGFVRFNPFKDTGGDQSFVLAILDGRDNGIVISSLHGRTGSRWYAKTIIDGKGQEHDLSGEEVKAIKQAKEQK
ncbi:DUF4446 family protein [Candidatus Microgenomates bacterium]|nr:DUF4446 family protein [Candidatus Microgenomates bacterium]